MAKAIITKEIQQKVSDIIDPFNKKAFKKSEDLCISQSLKETFST